MLWIKKRKEKGQVGGHEAKGFLKATGWIFSGSHITFTLNSILLASWITSGALFPRAC